MDNRDDFKLTNDARVFAIGAHRHQKYGNGPYSAHLMAVVDILKEFGAPPFVIAAGWLHDTLEDTKTTEAQLAKKFGPKVAALVSDVTFEDGLDRIEQLEAKVMGNMPATMLKLADRIANVEATCEHWNPKAPFAARYMAEHFDFEHIVSVAGLERMIHRYNRAITNLRIRAQA